MEGNKKKDLWKIERSKAPKRRKKIKWIEKKHQQQNLVQHSLFAPSKITSRNEKEHHIISIISENQPVSQTYPMKKKSFLLKSRTCVSLGLFAFWWTSFMTVIGPDPIQANTSIANGKRTSRTREIFLSSSFRIAAHHRITRLIDYQENVWMAMEGCWPCRGPAIKWKLIIRLLSLSLYVGFVLLRMTVSSDCWGAINSYRSYETTEWSRWAWPWDEARHLPVGFCSLFGAIFFVHLFVHVTFSYWRF